MKLTAVEITAQALVEGKKEGSERAERLDLKDDLFKECQTVGEAMNEDWEPDWIDLNDWLVLTKPEFHKATRYISDMSLQYRIWITEWRKSGSPDIEENLAQTANEAVVVISAKAIYGKE